MARDPFTTDDILANFYNPGRGASRPATKPLASVPPRHSTHSHPSRRAGDVVPLTPLPVANATPAHAYPAAQPFGDHELPPVTPWPVAPAAPSTELDLEVRDDQDGAPKHSIDHDLDMDLNAAPAGVAAGNGEVQRKAKPTHYKIVCISLYTEDIARLESMVTELKRRGHTKANKSQLIRYALEQVDLSKVPRSG